MIKKRIKRKDELKNILLGIEMNLAILEDDLDILNKDLIFYNRYKEELISNIDLHRTQKVVTVASSFRLSKNELKITNQRISQLTSAKNKVEKMINNKSKSFEYYNKEYEKINNDQVVLQFKKRAKNK
jgi:hypothetical protein